MTDIFIEGKVKPDTKDAFVADVADIDAGQGKPLSTLDSITQVSPGFIDKSNIQSQYFFTAYTRPGLVAGATKAQVEMHGTTQSFSINPNVLEHTFRYLTTGDFRTQLAGLADNFSIFATVRFLDDSDVVVAETLPANLEVITGPSGNDDEARKGVAENKNAITALAARNALTFSITPDRIDAIADLDGDYTLDWRPTSYFPSNANEMAIWFGSETVHVVAINPSTGPFRINFNVSTSEETQIGASGNSVLVRAVLYNRSGGGETYISEVAELLEVGPDHEHDISLTQREQIELIGIRLRPRTVSRDDVAGTYGIRYETPPFNVWADMLIAGQPLPRQALHGANSRNYTISNDLAETLENNDPNARSYNIEIRVYDAATDGNLITTIRESLSVVDKFEIADDSIGEDELKVTMVANEAAYDALTNKDAEVIYYWPVA